MPLFIWLSFKIKQEINKNSLKIYSAIRKLSVNFLIFLVSITFVSDLIYILCRFINGDITTVCFLKGLILCVICALLFIYYVSENSLDEKNLKKN